MGHLALILNAWVSWVTPHLKSIKLILIDTVLNLAEHDHNTTECLLVYVQSHHLR